MHQQATIVARDQMAQAAQVFRERNEETGRLLEQTRELTRRHEQVITELERSNRELDGFAHLASHDLRAPLRAMTAAVDWLEEDLGDAVPPNAVEHLVLLRGRVTRMNRLLEDRS